MNILYLVDFKGSNGYRDKMSRVRFHSVEAIGKICELKWSGKNWENYDNNLTAQENINILYSFHNISYFTLKNHFEKHKNYKIYHNLLVLLQKMKFY